MPINFNPDGGNRRQFTEKKNLDSISSVEREYKDGKMIETAKNASGQILKVSIFTDRNKDGKFDASEAVSVKYFSPNSRSKETVEYRDNDGDGYADEIIESNWTGNQSVRKPEQNAFHGNENNRMDLKYGAQFSNAPWFLKGSDGGFDFKS